jgi:hypothetical protein
MWQVRVTALEDTTEMAAVGVKLATSTMSRIDKVMEKIRQAKSEVVSAVASMTEEQASILNYSSWVETHEQLLAMEDWYVNAAEANNKKLSDELLTEVDSADDLVSAIESTVDQALMQLEEAVATGIAEANAVSGYTDSDEWVFQNTGFYPDEIEKYWDGKIVTSASEVSEVSGRKFYKVKFNIREKGYWSPNSDEMFAACRGLSNYLRKQDGIERDLRPPCNHYGHWRRGGLGQCIFIFRSYFSHCGGGGYWRETWTCAGTPEAWLTNIVGYEDLQDNYDNHYVHVAENRHNWQGSQTSSSFEYTLCTGGNQNYRL